MSKKLNTSCQETNKFGRYNSAFARYWNVECDYDTLNHEDREFINVIRFGDVMSKEFNGNDSSDKCIVNTTQEAYITDGLLNENKIGLLWYCFGHEKSYKYKRVPKNTLNDILKKITDLANPILTQLSLPLLKVEPFSYGSCLQLTTDFNYTNKETVIYSIKNLNKIADIVNSIYVGKGFKDTIANELNKINNQ